MRRSKKRRHDLRRITKVFETQYKGKVRYQIFSELHEVDSFCKAAEMIARTTYQRGLAAGFYDNVENRERLALAAQKGWFRAYVVFVEDQPIVFQYGERVADRMHLICTGFDPSFRKYEVGTILFLKVVEDLLAQGIKEIDYGPGGAQYKERFGDQCLREQDVDIYAPTLKGYSIHLISTLEQVINRAGKRFIGSLNISDKIKRNWRANLATKANQETIS
jgi:CelD/BcsL family acetyltransferase involved in cellulose biosynthesis